MAPSIGTSAETAAAAGVAASSPSPLEASAAGLGDPSLVVEEHRAGDVAKR